MAVMTLALILALAPLLASAGYSEPSEYMIKADGFTISIDSSHPALKFYRENSTEPDFSISYDRLILYSGDIERPEYVSNLSASSWHSMVGNSTEENGTVRTVVTMTSTISLSGEKDIGDWGLLSFTFLILARGEHAQLGISMSISGMKPVESCSNLAIVQSIGGDASFVPDSDEIIISNVYCRWNPTATVDINGAHEKRDVGAEYSDHSLSLIYPYNSGMQSIMHVSGQVELGHAAVMPDYFSDALGYGLGMLSIAGLLGISYAVKGKRKKSPFDMDSPIYRK